MYRLTILDSISNDLACVAILLIDVAAAVDTAHIHLQNRRGSAAAAPVVDSCPFRLGHQRTKLHLHQGRIG